MREADDASSTSARDQFVDYLLAKCENIYNETANPAFAWQAIDYCNAVYWGHQNEIPEWCFPTIFDAARKIVALIKQMELPAGDTPKARRRERKRIWAQLSAGLGLSSKGKNQLANAASALRRIAAAEDYHFDRSANKRTAKGALGDTRKALDAVRKARPRRARQVSEEDQIRTAFAVVAEGVRLSTGGKAAPRRRSGKGKVIEPAG